MPSLVVPGAVQVRLLWSIQQSGSMINVIGGQKLAGTVNQATADQLGAAIKSAFTSGLFSTHISGQVFLGAVGLRDISSANLAEFLDSGTAVGGTATDDELPSGNALVITLRTAKAGQSFRGRIYLGGFSEASNGATATVDPAVVTDSVNFVQAISSAMTASGFKLAVVSRPSDITQEVTTITHANGSVDTITKNVKPRPGGVEPVTLIEARNAIWDSQRRRSAPGSTSTLLRGIARANP